MVNQHHKWSRKWIIRGAQMAMSHKSYNDFLLSIGTDEADVLSPLVCQIKSMVAWYLPSSSNGRCDDI